MAGIAPKKLLTLLCCILVYFGCGGEPEEPRFSPERLHIDADAGTSRNARIMVTNPGPAQRTLDVETSSDLLATDADRMNLNGEEDHQLILQVHCPAEPGDYEEYVRLSDPDRADAYTIDVEIRCHPAPASGEGTLSIEIHGLPEGQRGEVELIGPDFVEAWMTESTELAELPSGRYSLQAHSVEIKDRTYHADPETLDLTLWPDEHQELVFEYSAQHILDDRPPVVDFDEIELLSAGDTTIISRSEDVVDEPGGDMGWTRQN